jgi:pyridoxal phosphate enzyme (YggS family)
MEPSSVGGDTMASVDTLAQRAVEVRARVAAAAGRSGRTEAAVQIVAVSKTIPAATVQRAFELGFTTFGENRVQEARGKIQDLPLPGIRWELIGHLQTNKAARAVQLFSRVQSVDSLRLAELLHHEASQLGLVLPILLEVNIAGESSKSGFAPGELVAAVAALRHLSALRPEGLMTIAPIVADSQEVRPVFRELVRWRDRLRQESDGWNALSMGMSDDFEVAIEEGATIVRIGRALFGARA